MNFCNKNVFFSKKYAIFIYVNVSEGSFDLFAQFQAPFYEFNEINWDNRNRKERFWCIRSLFRSLSFQLVKYCRPPIEGDFPFIGVEEFFIPFERVEKKDSSFDEPFLYLVMRFARGYKKRTSFSASSFIPFKRLKKRAQLALSSFYTPKRFRTAVAGMKIPSPGPLDDRGVLCEDKYRIL